MVIIIFGPQVVGATSLSPTIFDLKLAPGESATYQIKLFNETSETIYIDGSIEKFIPQGETGAAQILPFDVTDQSINWLKLPNNSLVLKPDEEISVPVIIDVPRTADIGGYYLAVMWQSAPNPQSTKSDQTLISSRVGSLVLLEVTGEVNHNLEIVDFDFKNNSKFYLNRPVDFFLRLRNSGSVHERPQGSIVIKNFFGQTIEALDINFARSAILPNTTRIFEVAWAKNSELYPLKKIFNFTIGFYSAKVIIDYGDNQSLISEPIYFWVIPWPILILTLIIIIIVIILIKVFKKRFSNKFNG